MRQGRILRGGLLGLTTIAATVPTLANMAGNPLLEVRRAESEIRVDGLLDEPAWRDALIVELDYEVRPGENTPPPVRTEVRVTYDERRVYFGFVAHDPAPEKIRARLSDRDRAWNDDWVGIVLDTFNDQRRAYELFSNPLGIQIDAINDDANGNYDSSWNAIWDSAGRITESGYQVEIAVPFNQIRFQSVDGRQVWGFDAIRSYPRKDRHHIGLFPRDRGNNSYLAQTVKLVGMEDVSPGRNLELIPTLTASRTDARADLPDGELEEVDTDADLGLTVRWGVTPNMSLNGAVNPDFSQVEADAIQLDVNEQFALFFPETRPFFLEGADYFNTGLRLVNTRTVADPSAAAKLTGKQGAHTIGFFTARDDVTNVIFPGAQGSSSGSFDFESQDSVGRYRYDFGRASFVGATLTDRRGDGYSNSVLSADTVFKMTEADSLSASFASSWTEYSDEMLQEFEANNGVPLAAEFSDGRFRDDAYSVTYHHGERGWWTRASYTDFGPGFRSDIGFRPRVDVNQWIVGGAKVWWGDDDDWYNRIGWGGDVDRAETQDGELLEEEIETWLNVDLPREGFLYVGGGARNRVFDGNEFDQTFVGADFNMRASRDFWFGMGVDVGDWIDFDTTRPADRLILRPRLTYNFGRHLQLEYRHTYQELDAEGNRVFEIHAPELRVVHQFNRRSFVRGIFQYIDIERPEQASRSEDLLAQLLFTYRLNAGTALFVGYTDIYTGNESFDLTETDRTFFMKLSYAWLR